MLALWQDNWRTAPLLTSPRPLLLEAAGHRENFPSCYGIGIGIINFTNNDENLIPEPIPARNRNITSLRGRLRKSGFFRHIIGKTSSSSVVLCRDYECAVQCVMQTFYCSTMGEMGS